MGSRRGALSRSALRGPCSTRWRRALRPYLYLARAHRRRRRDDALAYVELHELVVRQRCNALDLAFGFADSATRIRGIVREGTAAHANRDVVRTDPQVAEIA